MSLMSGNDRVDKGTTLQHNGDREYLEVECVFDDQHGVRWIVVLSDNGPFLVKESDLRDDYRVIV